MPAQWTEDIVGKMHGKSITKKQLAQHLGYCPEYVSMVLNGHRAPKGAEEKFRKAVDELSHGAGADQSLRGEEIK